MNQNHLVSIIVPILKLKNIFLIALARNAGLDIAKGDLICFVDGDDCLDLRK